MDDQSHFWLIAGSNAWLMPSSFDTVGIFVWLFRRFSPPRWRTGSSARGKRLCLQYAVSPVQSREWAAPPVLLESRCKTRLCVLCNHCHYLGTRAEFRVQTSLVIWSCKRICFCLLLSVSLCLYQLMTTHLSVLTYFVSFLGTNDGAVWCVFGIPCCQQFRFVFGKWFFFLQETPPFCLAFVDRRHS